MRGQNLAVVSSVNDGKPESALVAFAEMENLQIVFGTSDTTRKYKNLKNNQHISFVIGRDDRDARITIQYEGIAAELAGDEAQKYAALLAEKNPATAKFLNDPHQRYFLVTPTWIRYSNYSGTPREIFENFC